MTLMALQVGDLLVGIGDVLLADSSPQEAMAQVASIVQVMLAVAASHVCQDKAPAYQGRQGLLENSGPYPQEYAHEIKTCLMLHFIA